MTSTGSATEIRPRCTLCPAGCAVEATSTGPDVWRTEFPMRNEGGVCPRGAVLGQLIGHRSRVLAPLMREGEGWRHVSHDAAVRRILDEAKGRGITFFLDGNVPVESMLTAGAWCSAWPEAKLCLVIEPSDEAVLLGVEAGGAKRLSPEALKDCDGFLMIGDVFAANPTCSRGVFDRRSAEARTPIASIDPARGTAGKFAGYVVETEPGGEFAALAAVAAAAGVDTKSTSQPSPSAVAAGKALSGCKKLAVMIAADYGRTNDWQRIGALAASLAQAKGGGVMVQTVGANALAAVRLRENLAAVTSAEALLSESSVKVAVGCDILGMLGWKDSAFFASATPFVDRTAQGAQVLLPVAAPGESGGHFASIDGSLREIAPMMSPPAGVPTPADLVAAFATAAGVSRPKVGPVPKSLERIKVSASEPADAAADPASPVLLIARQAMHAGCGSLTRHGSWQEGTMPIPEIFISREDADKFELKNEATAVVSSDDASVDVRVLIAPELPTGRIVIADGFPAVRQLLPGTIDRERKTVFAMPRSVRIQKKH